MLCHDVKPRTISKDTIFFLYVCVMKTLSDILGYFLQFKTDFLSESSLTTRKVDCEDNISAFLKMVQKPWG